MVDLFNLHKKIVLITGSTRGIGYATADLFAQHGAIVCVNGRNQKDVLVAVERINIKNKSTNTHPFPADIRQEESVVKMVNEIQTSFGQIDILINNAGVGSLASFEDVSEKTFTDEMLPVHLTGLFLVTKHIVKMMKERHEGLIINMASQMAVSGLPHIDSGSVPYATAKGGVIAFTKGMARELGEFNIRINAIVPGLIETTMVRGLLEDTLHVEKIVSGIPLRRIGTPEEIAGVCLFLASPLSSYITGEIIAVNGGLPSLLYL